MNQKIYSLFTQFLNYQTLNLVVLRDCLAKNKTSKKGGNNRVNNTGELLATPRECAS